MKSCPRCLKSTCEGMWYCGCSCHCDEWEAHIKQVRADEQRAIEIILQDARVAVGRTY